MINSFSFLHAIVHIFPNIFVHDRYTEAVILKKKVTAWLPSYYNIFSRRRLCIAIMNEDIGKLVYDGMQRRKKTKMMKRSSQRFFKIKFKILVVTCLYFTKNCFVACELHVFAMMLTVVYIAYKHKL